MEIGYVSCDFNKSVYFHFFLCFGQFYFLFYFVEAFVQISFF